MKYHVFTKKTVTAIMLGLIVMAVIGILSNLLTFYVSSNYIRTLSPQSIVSVGKSAEYMRTLRFIGGLSLLGMLLGGIVAGYYAKKRGWVVGIYVGLISILFSCVLLLYSLTFKNTVFTSRIPTDLVNTRIMATFIKILKDIPLTLFFTAFGGFIGEKIAQKKSYK